MSRDNYTISFESGATERTALFKELSMCFLARSIGENFEGTRFEEYLQLMYPLINKCWSNDDEMRKFWDILVLAEVG